MGDSPPAVGKIPASRTLTIFGRGKTISFLFFDDTGSGGHTHSLFTIRVDYNISPYYQSLLSVLFLLQIRKTEYKTLQRIPEYRTP